MKRTARKKGKAKKTLVPRPHKLEPQKIRTFPWHWLAISAVFFLCAGIRFHLRDIALERDEGEYAYAGQLILQGGPPYQLAYNMKLPGTYASYALIEAVFGQTSAGIHLGLLVVNAATVIMLFLLGRKLLGTLAGTCAASSYAIFSIGRNVSGLAGHATNFVVLAALPGLLLLLSAIEKDSIPRFFASGSFFGAAFVMKQPGLVFCGFALLYLLYVGWERRHDRVYLISRAGALAMGCVWPLGLTCLIMLFAGVFQRFWFWTFSYARAYASAVPFSLAMSELKSQAGAIFMSAAPLWIIATFGLAALLLSRPRRLQAVFIAGLLAFSFAGVAAGFHFRGHYFILALPAAALLCGFAVEWTTQLLDRGQARRAVRAIPASIFALALLATVALQRDYLFPPDVVTACRMRYPGNPFVEAKKVGEYLRDNTPPDARVAVIGSEPEIYFYSRRRSATGYIYTYPLMEDQPYAEFMQEEMMQELTRSLPDYMLFVDDYLSWLWQPGASRERFLAQVQMYLASQYELVARVDIAGRAPHLLDDVPRIYLYHRTGR